MAGTDMGFERMAVDYDASRGEYPPQTFLDGMQAAFPTLELKNSRVLDAGAGTGQVSLPLLMGGANVTALDLSPGMLRIADERCAEFQNYQSVVGSATSIPFLNHSFDLIVARLLFEWIPDWRRAVREIHRVMKPAGSLLIIFTDGITRTTPRRIFEAKARRRGLKISMPGSTNRLLAAYLRSQGGVITETSPPELEYVRKIPYSETLDQLRSRTLNHLVQVSEPEYDRLLAQTEAEVSEQVQAGECDESGVVTRFWKVDFPKRSTPVANALFMAAYTASRMKRTVPRLARRTAIKLHI